MKSLIRPTLVAFDSAHLGALAADWRSSDPERRRREQAFSTTFAEAGAVVVLSFHHVQELLSHGNETVATDRARYLQSLPLIAAVNSVDGDGTLGAITDLLAFEVAAALQEPGANALSVRDKVSATVFRFLSGHEIMQPFFENWSDLRAAFAARENRSREIIAISRSNFAGNSEEKVVDLLRGQARTVDDRTKQFERLGRTLSHDIATRGDRRIPNSAVTASVFLDEVKKSGEWVIEGDNPGKRILDLFGIGVDEIEPDTTVRDVGQLGVFRQKLRLISDALQLPFDRLRVSVKPDRIPSEVISSAIAKYHPDTQEWDGSELADRHLACLSAYADVTYVDKRTLEASRQARSGRSGFALIAKPLARASTYMEIAQHVLKATSAPL